VAAAARSEERRLAIGPQVPLGEGRAEAEGICGGSGAGRVQARRGSGGRWVYAGAVRAVEAGGAGLPRSVAAAAIPRRLAAALAGPSHAVLCDQAGRGGDGGGGGGEGQRRGLPQPGEGRGVAVGQRGPLVTDRPAREPRRVVPPPPSHRA